MRFTNKFPYTNINNINLDWIIKRVKELGGTVRSYAQDIANAVALAEAAQEAAESVTSTAESAVATAQAAETTANAIAGTANNALSTAQAAETAAQAAEATANAIEGTANSALSTAQAANTTAQAANTTAQAAEESANNAETIAGAASANASNAVQTANTALATAEAANTTAQAAEESANNAETIAGAASANASNAVQTANTALATAEAALNEKAGKLVDSETGAMVSFVPDRTIEQDLSVSVAVEPVQAGSGVPSPDNVRPISGWNVVVVNHSGDDASNPTTYVFRLGQTVYGGTLDATNGKMTVDRTGVDLGTETWMRQAYNNTYRFVLSNFHSLPGSKTSGGYDPNALCSMYPSNASPLGGNAIDDCFCVYNGIVLIRDDSYSTLEAFSAAMSGVMLVYPLATPFEILLDPVQIAAIAGQVNSVWADAGNVTVEFAADLKWYIDKEIAELQALVLENGG